MRVKGAFIFSAAIAVVAAWALLQTAGWPFKASLYPRVIGVPLLLLAVGESVLSLRRTNGMRSEDDAMDFKPDESVPSDVAARRTAAIVLWLGGFFLAVLLVGFQAAVPIFVFAFVRGYGREGWVLSAFLAVLAVGVFHFLFVSLLHLPFPTGLILRALGR